MVTEIQEHAGNPERIRSSLAAAGQQQYTAGVERRQLDVLGPVLCHVIRPLVWEKGLWSIEVEKSWTHLFDIVACLMKLGYPDEEQGQEDDAFPTFAHVVLIRDTWAVILRQVNTLGMETFQKLFEINSEVQNYFSPSCTDLDPACIKTTNDAVKAHATHTLAVLQNAVNNIDNLSELSADMARSGKVHAGLGIDHGILDVMGPVFCNTTRPFLVMQGRWSLDVERSWLLLFREICSLMRDGYESSGE